MSTPLRDPNATGFLKTEKFDFMAVGGGTSGLAVASRLTEDPTVKVLVLEASANRLDDPRIVTPGLAAGLYDDPGFDWCFMSTPQVRTAPSRSSNLSDIAVGILEGTAARPNKGQNS